MGVAGGGAAVGLRELLTARAVAGAHVLVVECPGWWPVRVAVEQAVVTRGWRLALSPADADVLLVCGRPGERLAAAVELVWEQLPGPRARVAVTDGDAATELDRAAAVLADDAHQRADARERRQEPVSQGGGDDEMAPAGIPLAGGGDDRDGLEMDLLHVPLGPVLPHWPPGLVLRCVLNGDVVTEAEVEVLDGAGEPPFPTGAPELVRAARRCDAAAGLLAVAGWDDAAETARRLRDALLADPDRDQVAGRLDRLRIRVARSWSLRWQLRGLGASDDAEGGDVRDRLVGMLDAAAAALRGEPPRAADRRPAGEALPAAVAGLELAAVRLVVAGLDPETAPAVGTEPGRA
jgi:hypothetical protein